MYHTPYHLRRQGPIYIGFEKPRRVNGLGITGFVVSLLALLFTFGLFSPFGLILSLLGMLRRPRGWAFAGVLLGMMGTAIWVLIGLRIFAGVDHANAARTNIEFERADAVVQQTLDEVDRYRVSHDGRAPNGIEGNKLAIQHKDPWGTPLRYEVYEGVVAVRSAGPDDEFETADDVVCGRKVPRKAFSTFDTTGIAPSDVRID